MARIRKFTAYRRLERPYTRMSKFREKSFIRATPHLSIVKFNMGNLTKQFPYRVDLCSKDSLQIRHNALESARMTSNRLLEKVLGKAQYRLQVRVFPHHVLRENPLAAGAGADRMSTGMKRSFGKPIGRAAQVKKGQCLFSIYVNKSNLPVARQAISRAKYKIPCSTSIDVVELKK